MDRRQYRIHNDSELEAAIAPLGEEPRSGLLVIPEPSNVSHLDRIITQANRLRLPALFSFPNATKRGALISYSYPFDASIQQPVSYIDRILKGAPPSDLPVQAPDQYLLSINLKTAKALGLTVPAMLLATADEAIE